MVSGYFSSTGPSIVQTPKLWSQLSPTSLNEDQLSIRRFSIPIWYAWCLKDAALSIGVDWSGRDLFFLHVTT